MDRARGGNLDALRAWQRERLAAIDRELVDLRSLRALWRAWWRLNQPSKPKGKKTP